MANKFIIQQCENIAHSIDIFEMACKLAAEKDDGIISREEQKTLHKIKAAGDKYKRELEKIKKR